MMLNFDECKECKAISSLDCEYCYVARENGIDFTDTHNYEIAGDEPA